MDVSKRVCNREQKFLFEIKEGCKVPCVKVFCKSQYLLKILKTLLTFKNSEKVVKIGCFEKRLRWRVPIFYRNKGGI